MAQVNKKSNAFKLANVAGILALIAVAAKLLSSHEGVTQLDAVAMKVLTSSDTIKTIQGDGSKTLHVFLSTDCPYCRQVEPELGKLENVTVHRHLLPGHSEEGRRSAIAVWCAASPIDAWRDVAGGRGVRVKTIREGCDKGALERNLEVARRLGLTSTPAMIYEDGHVSSGMLSAGKLTKELDGAATR